MQATTSSISASSISGEPKIRNGRSLDSDIGFSRGGFGFSGSAFRPLEFEPAQAPFDAFQQAAVGRHQVGEKTEHEEQESDRHAQGRQRDGLVVSRTLAER